MTYKGQSKVLTRVRPHVEASGLVTGLLWSVDTLLNLVSLQNGHKFYLSGEVGLPSMISITHLACGARGYVAL